MKETPTSLILTLNRHYGEEVELEWAEIEYITAYKQDLFNPQIVLLEVCCAGNIWEIEVADCNDYALFSQLLTRRLSDVTPYNVWWPAVTNPLARHEAVNIYQRS